MAIAKCPNCGAPDKQPDRPKTYRDAYGMLRNRMTDYTCGTTTSPDWKPPLYGRDCIEGRAGPGLDKSKG